MLKRTRTRIILLTIFLVCGWMLTLNQNSQGYAGGENRYIRLHILANSDTQDDQELKLKVRDAVITYLTPKLKDTTDASEARQIIEEQRNEILYVVEETLRSSNKTYSASLQTGWFEFPLRSYGSLILPAGKYEAVRILLGEGKGQNWWCVLFPPLCIVDATGGYIVQNGSGGDAKGGKVELRWKLLEVMAKD